MANKEHTNKEHTNKEHTNKKHILFIVDRSGSMNSGKLESAKQGIIDNLKDAEKGIKGPITLDDDLGLLSFNTAIQMEVDIKDFSNAKSEIMNSLKQLSSGNSTALYDAIGRGADELDSLAADEPWIICLTDGKENASQKFGTDQEVIDHAKKKGVNLRIIIIGIGRDVDNDALRNIAGSCNGQYIKSKPDPGSVRASFQQAGEAIKSGAGGNADIPDYVEIDAEEGMIGDVDPEDLARHSIPHAPPKPPGHGDPPGKGGRKERKEPDKNEYTEHEHHPPRRTSAGPGVCRQVSEEQVELVRYVTKNCRNFMDLNMGWRYNLSVPVRYIDEDTFLELWPRNRSDPKLCEYFMAVVKLLEEITDRVVPHPCFKSGKPFIKFISDLEFGRNENKYKNAGVNSPGIYIRGDYSGEIYSEEKRANLDLGMSAVVIEAMEYYHSCRERAVEPLSPIHPLMYSVIGMLALPPERRQRVIERSAVVGTWGIPIYILRMLRMVPPEKVLEYLLSVLPVDVSRKGLGPDGLEHPYDEISVIMNDIRELVKRVFAVRRNGRGGRMGFTEDLLKVLDKMIYHRRIRYRPGGLSVHPRSLPGIDRAALRGSRTDQQGPESDKSPNIPPNYDILPLGSYIGNGRRYHVFEVARKRSFERCYAVRVGIPRSDAGNMKGHCTCKGFRYHGEKGPCKHIEMVLSTMELAEGGKSDVAARIRESFWKDDVYQ